jgi:hypothetical protein
MKQAVPKLETVSGERPCALSVQFSASRLRFLGTQLVGYLVPIMNPGKSNNSSFHLLPDGKILTLLLWPDERISDVAKWSQSMLWVLSGGKLFAKHLSLSVQKQSNCSIEPSQRNFRFWE